MIYKLSLCLFAAPLVIGCDPDASAPPDDDLAAVEHALAEEAQQPEGGLDLLEELNDAGASAVPLYCEWERNYTYSYGGFNYGFNIWKPYGTHTIYYGNYRTDNGWWDEGTLSQWSFCPGQPNESVVVDPSDNINHVDGPPKTCTHVCLPSPLQEELHCPNGQFGFTRVYASYECDPCEGPSPPPYCDKIH